MPVTPCIMCKTRESVPIFGTPLCAECQDAMKPWLWVQVETVVRSLLPALVQTDPAIRNALASHLVGPPGPMGHQGPQGPKGEVPHELIDKLFDRLDEIEDAARNNPAILEAAVTDLRAMLADLSDGAK